jgi:hypothetical protein
LSEADEEELDLFQIANLRPATTGLPMIVWFSERGLARYDVRVKGQRRAWPAGHARQNGDRRGAPGAAARRRSFVSCRFAGGRRLDPAQ